MNNLNWQMEKYLNYCQYQKRLNEKTLKAYRIDLKQFELKTQNAIEPLSKSCIIEYLEELHKKYKPKTVRRKIACLRAFVNYLEFDEQIEINPLNKVRLDFREPKTLPKSVSIKTITNLLITANDLLYIEQTKFQYNTGLRNRAILELMFATGL